MEFHILVDESGKIWDYQGNYGSDIAYQLQYDGQNTIIVSTVNGGALEVCHSRDSKAHMAGLRNIQCRNDIHALLLIYKALWR